MESELSIEAAIAVVRDSSVVEDMNFVEAENSELIGMVVDSEDIGYEMYNSYAYKIGFGISRHNYRYIGKTEIVKGRELVCCKEGFKKKRKYSENVAYTKLVTRTNCKAKIYLEKTSDGKWTVSKHDMVHNHRFCDRDKIHTLNSHRHIMKEQIALLQNLVDAGCSVPNAVKFMSKEAGGSPSLGFGTRDAYNALKETKKKAIDGTDSNTLIQKFIKRQGNEKDFHFNFGVDEADNFLAMFMWRDGKMKKGYEAFYPYVGIDSTYRTNKYDLICVPIIGINHHGQNCMFACGFLLNENAESYIWLFTSFLEAMGNVHPLTIMTDQSAALAPAIQTVFPQCTHRLCTWHISENSKKHIKHLRGQDGFMNLFNHVLMYCDSIFEFEHFWQRMMVDQDCADNKWLANLYLLKEKWSPVFSKDKFSGGVLSSQRSETTNKSVSEPHKRTASLCEFYNCFCEVVDDWRKIERHEDARCSNGLPDMAIQNLPILNQARRVYTIQVYRMFEEQYMIGLTCGQKLQQPSEIHSLGCVYLIWRPGLDVFAHQVAFDMTSHIISCTCKRFTETGILCCHCLRIYNLHSVQELPFIYIAKRWTKEAKGISENVSESSSSASINVETASFWRMRMRRNFNHLLVSSDSNLAARRICEEAFDKACSEVQLHIGSLSLSDNEADKSDKQAPCILNPNKSRKKYEKNERKRSIIEKKSNRVRTRKRIAETYGSSSKEAEVAAPFPLFVNPL